MKKIFAGFLLLGGIFAASAQTISFDKTTIDYGTIGKDSGGHRYFVIKNTGDKPLIISNVKPSCGCTTPEWSKDPILPGKSSVIKVGYNTANVGSFNKLVEVFSNDPANGRSVLWIKGNVDAAAAKTEDPTPPSTDEKVTKAKKVKEKKIAKTA